MAVALLKSNGFAERLRRAISIEELHSIEIEILDYIENNPKDIVTSMILLIKCYMLLNDTANAELILNKCYSLVKRTVPFDLAMLKAMTKNIKGNTKEAVEIVRQLLKKKKLIERERISALVSLAVFNSNLAYYEEMYRVVSKLWNMINNNAEINFDDNSFYSKISQYTDARPFIGVMNNLKSYLNGKELLKDKTYADIYEYVKYITKDNPAIYDVIPYEEVDFDYESEKYFSLKIVSKPLSVDDKFELEIHISELIANKYPYVFVIVDVIDN
ncbi:MAG: hypothetical protein HQK99_07655 [Nitrospirae bacterium]|nr:hypothetical protein [Nitrospirota bacterium]